MKCKRLKMFICASSLAVSMLSAGWVASDITNSVVYAQDISNDFSGSGNTSQNSSGGSASDFLSGGNVSGEDQSVADFFRNQRGVTGTQLNEASNAISPITNAIGWVSGVIIALIAVGIFLVTAIDLLYIAIPPIRPFLYTAGTDGTGASTAGRYPSMYGGAYGGMQNQQQKRRIQFVSDECVQICALMGGSAPTEGIGMMNRMGGYGAQPQNQMSRGSVIGAYLKKRAVFIVILVVSIIVLMSSALMGFGVNLALWGIKIISAISNAIAF